MSSTRPSATKPTSTARKLRRTLTIAELVSSAPAPNAEQLAELRGLLDLTGRTSVERERAAS